MHFDAAAAPGGPSEDPSAAIAVPVVAFGVPLRIRRPADHRGSPRAGNAIVPELFASPFADTRTVMDHQNDATGLARADADRARAAGGMGAHTGDDAGRVADLRVPGARSAVPVAEPAGLRVEVARRSPLGLRQRGGGLGDDGGLEDRVRRRRDGSERSRQGLESRLRYVISCRAARSPSWRRTRRSRSTGRGRRRCRPCNDGRLRRARAQRPSEVVASRQPAYAPVMDDEQAGLHRHRLRRHHLEGGRRLGRRDDGLHQAAAALDHAQAGPDAVVAGWVESVDDYLAENGLSVVAGAGRRRWPSPGRSSATASWTRSANMPGQLRRLRLLQHYGDALTAKAGRPIPLVVGNDGNMGGVAEAQRVRGSARGRRW